MFGLGTYELLIVAVIILLLFGNRLPSVMRSLGRGVVEFKKGVAGIEDEVNRAAEDRPSIKSPNHSASEPASTDQSVKG